jgi:hypothetical protein
MKKLKKYENFFGGTHLGPDQVNTDSNVVRNNTFEPDEYSDEFIDDVETLKSDIMALLEENDFNSVQLEKIKSFIATL